MALLQSFHYEGRPAIQKTVVRARKTANNLLTFLKKFPLYIRRRCCNAQPRVNFVPITVKLFIVAFVWVQDITPGSVILCHQKYGPWFRNKRKVAHQKYHNSNLGHPMNGGKSRTMNEDGRATTVHNRINFLALEAESARFSLTAIIPQSPKARLLKCFCRVDKPNNWRLTNESWEDSFKYMYTDYKNQPQRRIIYPLTKQLSIIQKREPINWIDYKLRTDSYYSEHATFVHYRLNIWFGRGRKLGSETFPPT